MTSEIELFGKDSVRLNILKDITDGKINISIALDDGEYQDYFSRIHSPDSRMKVLGKFNLSENPSGEVLTIRPISVSGIMKIAFEFTGVDSDSERKLSIFRGATKSVECEYDINDMLTSVEFIPQGSIKYLLRLTYGEAEPEEILAESVPSDNRDNGDNNAVNDDVKAAEERNRKLKEKITDADKLIEKLEIEYQKDYDVFEKQLGEYKLQFGVDQSVLDYYKDNDIVPIEELMAEISAKLEQAEKQIAVVILGRQKKTMDIENEVKSNKRQ